MTRYSITLLVVAVVSFAAAPVPPQPLTFWRSGLDTERHIEQDALDCALERWRQATCLPLDVSYDAAHHVRLADLDELGGHTGGWTVGASWNATRIKINRDMSKQQICQVLTHELSHVLRRANTHPGLPECISNNTSGSITSKDIDYVCAKQDCQCQNPELVSP